MARRRPPIPLVPLALASVLTLAFVIATVGDADAARRSACQPSGSKTVVASGTARVFTRRGRDADAGPPRVTTLLGCRAGRRPVRMAVRATLSTSDDRGGYSEELEVFDLRSRRRSTTISPGQDVRIRDVVLMPSGNVAWIQGVPSAGPPPFTTLEVRMRRGATTVLLDSGRAIDPTSLASSGPILYWTNGARAATARLP